jgi:hypothetical protein
MVKMFAGYFLKVLIHSITIINKNLILKFIKKLMYLVYNNAILHQISNE